MSSPGANATSPAPVLSAEQASHFENQGFVAVDRLVSDETVTSLRAGYDAILSGEVQADGDRLLGELTRQVMRPHEAHRAFAADNGARRAAEQIAWLLFGAEPVFIYDMLIYKPPGHPAETPWHQDLAYAAHPTMAAGTPSPAAKLAQFWVALDRADEENGCMHFVPGVHRKPLLPHIVASGDPASDQRLLAIENVEQHLDLGSVAACPLPAGGATIHGYCTPHYTPPNRSANRARRAYIFTYAARGPRAV